MLQVRQEWGSTVNRWIGGTGGIEAEVAGGGQTSDSRTATLCWLAALVAILIVSFVLIGLAGASAWVVTVLAALWGVVVGGGLLFFLHQKLIITIAGMVIGASVGEIKSLLEGAKSLIQVGQHLAVEINGLVGPSAHVSGGAVVLFLVVVLLCCTPAYSR